MQDSNSMTDYLGWLRQQVPPFEWNLKGEPQGITARLLFEQSIKLAGPFESLESLVQTLFEHRQWFHLTNEEGRQVELTDLGPGDEIWVAERQAPWTS
jgi:hypothetical protein